MSIARAFTKKLMFVAEEAGKEAMDISRKQVLEAFHKKTKDEFKSNKVAELRKHLAEGDTFSFDVKGTTFTIRAKEGFDVAQLKKTFPKLMFHLQHFFNVVLGGFWRGGRLLKNQTIKLQKEALEKAKKAANNTPEKALEKLQTELREATDAGAPPDKIKAIKEKIAQAEEQINAPKQVGRLTEENEALQNKLGQYEAREFGREAGKQAADLIGGTTGTGNVHKQLKTKAADLASQLKDKDAILTAKNRHAQIIANDISIEETLSEVRNIARRKTFTTQSSLGHQVKELKTKAQELHHANLIDANELTTINQTIEQLEITQNQLNRVNTQKKSLETTIRQRERKLSQHTKMGKKSLTKPINSKATNSIQNDTILKTKQQQLKKLEQQERLLNTEASRQLQAAEDTMTQPLVNLREEMETLSPELKRTFNAKRAEAKKLEQLTKKKF